MGGAVGGAVKSVGQAVGVAKKTPAGQMAAKIVEESKSEPAPKPGVTQASQEQEQAGSRMRGARRRRRALLSDARLSGEMGVQTLGGGQNLG